MPRVYELPTHLQVQETLLLGLAARQLPVAYRQGNYASSEPVMYLEVADLRAALVAQDWPPLSSSRAQPAALFGGVLPPAGGGASCPVLLGQAAQRRSRRRLIGATQARLRHHSEHTCSPGHVQRMNRGIGLSLVGLKPQRQLPIASRQLRSVRGTQGPCTRARTDPGRNLCERGRKNGPDVGIKAGQ